jgi:hypothetical protein
MHLEERTTSLQSWEGHVYLNSELWWPKYRPCLPLFHNVDNGEICLNIHPLDVDFFSFGLQRSLQELFCHRNCREENGSASMYHNHLLFPLKYNYNYLAMRIAQVSGQRYRRGLYLFSHYSQNQKISIIFVSESHAHIQKTWALCKILLRHRQKTDSQEKICNWDFSPFHYLFNENTMSSNYGNKKQLTETEKKRNIFW